MAVAVWNIFEYLRPNRWVLRTVTLGVFAAAGLLGIYAATTRNETLVWAYFGILLASTVWMILITLDMMQIIILLRGKPHPETIHETNMLQFIRDARSAEEASMIERIGDEVARRLQGNQGSFSFINVDEDLNNLLQQMTPLNVPDDYERFLEAKTTTSTPNPLEHPPESRKERDRAKAKVEKAAENKNVLSATSGDAEEVAVDEMPPETAALPVVEQTVAEINMKGIKKAVKFIFSVPMILFTLILAYCDWVTLTFAVNKCASLDLFEQEADQFPALLPGEELAESAELDSTV